jgi:hypothetical protein
MIQSIKKINGLIEIKKDGKRYIFIDTVKNSKISKLLKTL